MTRPLALTLLLVAILFAGTAGAQAPLPGEAAPSYSSAELDRIVSPIALYPDPLLAQVLAAATYPADIPDAARWADGHGYLTGQRLTDAIVDDQVPWDPSVQALLPFPSVLDMMSRDMPWTQELGDAVLAERAAVMDAVQRMRHQAWTYGYLRSNGSVVVNDGPYIDIEPVLADVIVVPIYDPRIVFAPPRRGFAVATAIRFGSGVSLGVGFAPWGWGGSHFVWSSHTVVINRAPWQRTWANRRSYVHPFDVRRNTGERAVERHELRPKDDHERRAQRPEDRRRGSER
jgi:Protein of unknown function (DUF3300)